MECSNPQCRWWATAPPLALSLEVSFIEKDTDVDPPQ
jgi:hypothetical protein